MKTVPNLAVYPRSKKAWEQMTHEGCLLPLLVSMYLSNLLWNWLMFSLCMIVSGRLFHLSTTLDGKNSFLFCVLCLGFTSFIQCPLVPCCLSSRTRNGLSVLIRSMPLSILNVSIISPLVLLCSNVVRPSLWSRSSYGRWDSDGTSLVALLCTFSSFIISFLR